MSSVEKEEKSITRREFVKGAAVGAAAAVGAGVLASCTTPTPEVIEVTREVTKEVIKEVPVTKEVIKEVIKEVPAGGPTTLELYDPSGASEVTQLHAARLDTLDGKTICELWNEGWQGDKTFPVVRELLQKMYPTATIIPYTEFPIIPNEVTPASFKSFFEMVEAKGCDAVITGNGG